jgi:hypothetical protein
MRVIGRSTVSSDLYAEGWPEELHETLETSQVTMRVTLLGITALCASLGQEDPVTAALDIMRTRSDELISPLSLRALVEEFDAR